MPFTPVLVEDAVSRLFILWPDKAQLAVLDKSEPNYHRVRIDHTDVSIALESDENLSHCYTYISRHGHLIDDSERPILVPDAVSPDATSGSQDYILRTLLRRSGLLADTFGPDPITFIENAVRDPNLQDDARQIFRQLGWAASGQLEIELISRFGGTPENLARPAATTYELHLQPGQARDHRSRPIGEEFDWRRSRRGRMSRTCVFAPSPSS
ncbi:MAG TPA: hypothetical protein VFO16_04615 [Pseudonocardiaceae bacterium]|nr:hypothetical protein [Pseudonocardiaceae bacterium]